MWLWPGYCYLIQHSTDQQSSTIRRRRGYAEPNERSVCPPQRWLQCCTSRKRHRLFQWNKAKEKRIGIAKQKLNSPASPFSKAICQCVVGGLFVEESSKAVKLKSDEYGQMRPQFLQDNWPAAGLEIGLGFFKGRLPTVCRGFWLGLHCWVWQRDSEMQCGNSVSVSKLLKKV